MKKLLVTGAFAMLTFGLYAGLVNSGTTYVHEDYSSMSDAPYQDTMQKNKKKKDKKKKDTVFVSVNPATSQLAAR